MAGSPFAPIPAPDAVSATDKPQGRVAPPPPPTAGNSGSRIHRRTQRGRGDGHEARVALLRTVAQIVSDGQRPPPVGVGQHHLRYLEERTRSLLPSQLNSRRWIAFAAVPNPTLRYVAVIARVSEQPRFRLHVLDADNDEIADTDPAPAPPPTDFKCDPPPRPHQWGDEVDGLVEMDAGIIVLSADDGG